MFRSDDDREAAHCTLCNAAVDRDKPPAGSVGIFGKEVATAQLAGRICRYCMNAAMNGEPQGDDGLCDERLREWLPRLAVAMGRMPMSIWRESAFNYGVYDPSRVQELLTAAYNMPTGAAVIRLYGSWHNALIASGLVSDGLPASRGMRSISNDGHMCFSEGERTIDDWLHANGVPHEREPHYPNSKFRGDFLINGVFVEYYGLDNKNDYRMRMSRKQRAALDAEIRVVEVTMWCAIDVRA